MIELKFINAKNQEMNAIHNDYMTITAIDTLHGVDNEFSSSTSPYFDGDVVDHIRTNPRTITLTYALKPPIANSLNYFNSMVKSKQKAKLIETRDDGSQIEIEGIVTVPPYTRLSDQVAVQIQLYCSEPYWQDVLTMVTDISVIINLHYFPFESEEKLLANDGGIAFPEEGIPFGEIDTNSTKIITNEGDVATGMIIQIVALGKATNPRITRDNYNWIEINVEMNPGDSIELCTIRGNKYIKSNIGGVLNSVGLGDIVYSGNDWLQLDTGDNELFARSEEGSQTIYFSIFNKRKWQ